ncbi:MAG: AAA family ATPase [Scytonema sp. RU_4_4]|nr:AAA family ATPase [Scytonema sp. RU_4_4]
MTIVISWENITDRLKILKIDSNHSAAFSTVTQRIFTTYTTDSTTETSSDIYLPKPEYTNLLGREKEIENIKEVLSETRRGKIIGVDGFGGIGKTALVQEIIKSHSDVGFDKVIWQTASTRDDSEKMTFATVLDAIATQLNRLDLFKLKREEIEIKIRELLQEQPVLIVLDNMETSDEPQNEIIQKLLPILGSSKALLTSRHRFTETFGDNLFPIHLRGFNKEAAINLMEETATHKNMLRDFKAVKDNQLEQMIQVTGDESFGYTPMALKFILGQLQKFDPEVIVEGLEGVRLTDENGEISDKDEFKQFWKHIFLTSFKLLSYLDRKFMSGMTLFEPSIGSKYNEIMSTIRLSNEEFRLVVDSTWKVSFLEIGQIDSRKTYYLHRLSYTFFFAIISQFSKRRI